MRIFALLLALVFTPAHGFDYQFGTWNVHVSRLVHDTSGATKWVAYVGTHTVTPLWHGRANVGVLEIHGPAGRIEGLQLRLFNPATDRWKLLFASSSDGELQPPSVGSFHDGVGDFRDTEIVGGKAVIVRTLSTVTAPASYRDVIARSDDHGKTWTPLWIATYEKPVAAAAPASPDPARDFDFNLGTWHTHIRRLLRPLSHSNDWVQYDGTVSVRKALGGAANVEEIVANGPGHLEFLNVRLYNEKSRQWSLNGASSADGTLGTPMYGGFANGRGVFYDQEPFNGRVILERQTFFDITASSYAFEQAFSDDGGKTWEPNFVARLTRTSANAPSEGSQTIANTSHDFDFNYGTWSTHITSYPARATDPAHRQPIQVPSRCARFGAAARSWRRSKPRIHPAALRVLRSSSITRKHASGVKRLPARETDRSSVRWSARSSVAEVSSLPFPMQTAAHSRSSVRCGRRFAAIRIISKYNSHAMAARRGSHPLSRISRVSGQGCSYATARTNFA